MLIHEHVPLAPLTTLGVGGPARWFVEATSEAAVVGALSWASERGVPTLVLGGGSNLLVADRGFDGLVLRARLRGITGEDGDVEAAAGEPWDELVAHAVARGWAGIECLSGIPGDVGATPIQNVGAYGQEVAETIVGVRAVERSTGATVTLDGARCGFGYRDSVFKREDAGRFVVVAVRFALRPGGAPSLRYAELAKALAGCAAPSLAEVRETVIGLRRGKSMVLDPSDENFHSAGSFFMNPTLDAADFAEARARVAAAGVLRPGEEMPSYPAGARVKLSAAWLIERAGFHKGTRDGAVGISTRHSLAIVNRGGATAAEVAAFARRVRDGVLARFGVALTPEPVMVGFTAEELASFAPAPASRAE
jgi:UDP-N-acetylmuramate dehydrogenase